MSVITIIHLSSNLRSTAVTKANTSTIRDAKMLSTKVFYCNITYKKNANINYINKKKQWCT